MDQSLKSAVKDAVAEAIHDPTVPIEAALGAGTRVASEAVADKIAAIPEIQHATNTEAHWWQKRSFWSAIVGIGGVIVFPYVAPYIPGVEWTPATEAMVTDACMKVAAAWSGYLAIRAGTAKKPLGS